MRLLRLGKMHRGAKYDIYRDQLATGRRKGTKETKRETTRLKHLFTTSLVQKSPISPPTVSRDGYLRSEDNLLSWSSVREKDDGLRRRGDEKRSSAGLVTCLRKGQSGRPTGNSYLLTYSPEILHPGFSSSSFSATPSGRPTTTKRNEGNQLYVFLDETKIAYHPT